MCDVGVASASVCCVYVILTVRCVNDGDEETQSGCCPVPSRPVTLLTLYTHLTHTAHIYPHYCGEPERPPGLSGNLLKGQFTQK